MAITRSRLQGMKEKRPEAQETRSDARDKRLSRRTTNNVTITIRAPEPNEIGSFNNPHKFAGTTKSVLQSPPELVLLRSSDLHHVLVHRHIVVQSPNLMQRIEGRSGRPVMAGVLAGVLVLPIPYGVLLQALTFLHYRSTRPGDVVAEEVMCAGEKVLFEHGGKAFVYHLDVRQLEPLLEAALLLEVQPLVDLIRERISSTKQHSRAIIRTVLGLVDPSSD